MKKMIPCLLTMSLVLSPISTTLATETSVSESLVDTESADAVDTADSLASDNISASSTDTESADTTALADSLAFDNTSAASTDTASADTTTPTDSLASDAATSIPSPGQVINGFEVKELRESPDIRGTIVLFEHQKTGAELMYIANEDPNRAFDLTFATRAIDNTGLPHVLEHAVTSGSKKYPSRSLFLNLNKQAYVTRMGACTYSMQTVYPVASMSEEQLLKMADYYVDSCLHPMVLEDEEIFREQAWRYQMENPDADLTIAGTVYSEEQGRMDIETAARMNSLRTAFPGSTCGNIYGGDPDYIPEMTWEGLKSYYERYYHPSNSLAFLYGNFEDYTAFLKLLDEAYASYEKREITFEDSGYTPITEPVRAEFAFPIEEGGNTENQAVMIYQIVLPGLKVEDPEYPVFKWLCSMLDDSAVLKEKLQDRMSYGEFSVYMNLAGAEYVLEFKATQVNEKDAALFKEAIDEGLAELAEIGFSEEEAEACQADGQRVSRLLREVGDPGIKVADDIAVYYRLTGNPFAYLEQYEAVENIVSWNQEDVYRSLIKKWMVDNNLTALTTTYPAAGEKEKIDAALAARLAEIKSGMTEEEKQAIVEATQAQIETDDSSEYVRQLQVVTADTLPEDFPLPEIRDVTDERGVRHIDGVADVNGIGKSNLYFDAEGLEKEELLWARLYCQLLKFMPTSQHSVSEIKNLCYRYVSNDGIYVDVNGWGEDAIPVLRIMLTALDEDLPKAYELMEEILYETEFTDTERLLSEVQSIRDFVVSEQNEVSEDMMSRRGFGGADKHCGYAAYFGGFDYYQFIKKVEQQILEAPETVVSKLEEIQNYFHNCTNLCVTFSGNEQSIEKNRAAVDAFLSRLDQKPIEPKNYKPFESAKSEAIIVDSGAQANGIYAAWDTLGVEEYDASWKAIADYVTDTYLTPQLRVKYGAYTPWCDASDHKGLALISYYDPNIKETYQVFESLPRQIAEAEVDQETLNGYIFSGYNELTLSIWGELDKAESLFEILLAGDDPEVQRTYVKQLKAVTPQKIRDAAPILQKLVDCGVRETMGSASKIKENEELFDTVLSPFQD